MTIKEALDRRPEYVSGNITHQDYYETIACSIGLGLSDLPCSIEKVKRALAIGDNHLNTIPLNLWDERHTYIKHKARIGLWSIADTVCTLKALAVNLATKVV